MTDSISSASPGACGAGGSLRGQLFLYMAAAGCMAVATGVHDSIFNNYLAETFQLSARARGWLEFPREFPGFLAAIMTGALCMVAVTRVAMIGTLVFAAGMIGIVLMGHSFGPMAFSMFLASCGLHLLMPIGQSISIGLSSEHKRGARMGQVGAVETAGVIVGTASVWLLFGFLPHNSRAGFFIAAVLALISGLIYARMHIPHLHQRRERLVIRKKYSLYYLLEFVFGARKQIFLTFGPWVLIRIYGFPATEIAKLLMIAALIGVVFKPLAGRAIDFFGERSVLVADGIVLIFVCLGYGYASHMTHDPIVARHVACACFVADNLLFMLGSARAIYVTRLTQSPQEVTSTLAMGVTINHIVSMSIPVAGGLLWMHLGYERVFLAAAILAAGNAALALRVPRKGDRRPLVPSGRDQ